MTLIAWIVFLAATGYTIWDGVRRTRGAKDLEGFFAAGRSIPWWAAGLSVMATQLSAITILSGVGMGYENGLEWVQSYFALPFAMIVLAIWFVPMLRRHPVLTAYEYLERRFGPVTRSLTSAVFLLSRCLAFAAVLYAPAVVFSVMSGLSIGTTLWVTGLATTAYTVIGGTGGVVWTDVKQMAIIVLGIVTCVVILTVQVGGELGFGGLFTTLGTAGKLGAMEVTNPAWTFVPTTVWDEAPTTSFWSDKYNLWTGLFGSLFLFLSYFGCDQSQVQSILTAKSADASRSALLLSAFTKVPLQLVALLLGGLLYLHYAAAGEPTTFQPEDRELATRLEEPFLGRWQAASERHRAASAARSAAIASGEAEALRVAVRDTKAARAEAQQTLSDWRVAHGVPIRDKDDSNYILCHWMFTELPKPVLGLMLAAIFAAAISSAAGALSSLTSATMVDFYRRWIAPAATDARVLRNSRKVMACWGLLATFAAQWFGDKPLIEQVNQIGSWFYGSILGVFLLALFVPRASGLAASAGLLGGIALVSVGHLTLKIAFLWDNLIGCVGCLATGLVVTALAPRQPLPLVEANVQTSTRGWGRTYALVAACAVVVMLLLGWLSSVGRD